MSCACVMNEAACAALTFLPVCALTSLLNAPSSAHAALVSFAATSPRSQPPWRRGCGRGRLPRLPHRGRRAGRRVLDAAPPARRGDGDHEQRVRERHLARELMADVGRRRRVRGAGLPRRSGCRRAATGSRRSRTRVRDGCCAAHVDQMSPPHVFATLTPPDPVTAGGVTDAAGAPTPIRPIALDRALVGEPDVAVRARPDPAGEAARVQAGCVN